MSDKLIFKENKKYRHGSIIYGAGNAGKQVCDLVLSKNKNGVVCFIDDSPKKIGKKYKNINIYSRDILSLLRKKDLITNIIIAIPSLNNLKLSKLFNFLYNYSSSVLNLPLKSEYNSNQINLSDLQKSEIVNIFYDNNFKASKHIISNLGKKNILVTGAGGSIGSELVFQLSRIVKKKIICLDISELSLFKLKNNIGVNQKKVKLVLGDISDTILIKKIIKKDNIDIIFHTAAYKHLNFLEQNPIQAIKNNVLGTYNLIETSILASKKKLKMINISTDKAVRPTSILGISKRIVEIICQSYQYRREKKIDIATVRFGNVFGSAGSVVNLFLDKINNGENVQITDKKVERFFMSINEACNLVISASLLKKKFATFVLDMGKPVKIYDLLKKIIKLKQKKDSNFSIKIEEIGLQKGEKISEELTINDKVNKTSIKRILLVNEPKYSLSKVNIIISKIKKNIEKGNNFKLIKELKNFLLHEIKNY